jgi:septal ring factor EnvC (AmiA/AmiB activator)
VTRSGLLLVVLAACWAAQMAAPGGMATAGKDRSDPLSQKIERERRTLEKLKEEIRENKTHADATEKKKDSVLQTMQDLDDRLMARRHEHQDINRQLKEKDRELEEINEQIAGLKERLRDRRKSILARLRVQYMEGRFGYLKGLMTAESYTDLERRFRYLSTVSKREFDLMDGYRLDVDRLSQIERHRVQAREQMLVFKQNIEKKMEEIRGIKRQKHILLAKLVEEKEFYDRAVAELERSAARVDTLLRSLEQRRKAAALRPKGSLGLHRFKGTLQWPADGDVVTFFGRQKHPTFDTYVQRKGIEIRTNEGTAIKAVSSGTVAYADWLKGYGLLLIIEHPEGFFSLYAHASKLMAKAGDRVQAGQVVGETGDTGMTGEGTLYFELRDGAEPVDPLIWLAKRR